MTDHKEIIELLEKAYLCKAVIQNVDSAILDREVYNQALAKLRTAQEQPEAKCVKCGKIFYCEDDYDTLGSDSGVCCPICGGEDFEPIEQPPASKLTDWLRKTISGDRYEKGDKELQAKVREACDIIDQRQVPEQPPASEYPNSEFIKVQRAAARSAQDAYEEDEEWHPTKTSRLLEACERILTETQRADKAEEKVILQNSLTYCKEHKTLYLKNNSCPWCLQDQLKAKDKLLYTYESVKAPVNPLLAASKEMIKISRQVSSMAGKDWLQGQLLLIDKTDDFEDAIIKAKQS